LQGFKLQFEIYLVPTKPLVVSETLRKRIQILMGRTVYVYPSGVWSFCLFAVGLGIIYSHFYSFYHDNLAILTFCHFAILTGLTGLTILDTTWRYSTLLDATRRYSTQTCPTDLAGRLGLSTDLAGRLGRRTWLADL
jgi:hypothetical protein